jgi:hypothetical protein
MGVLVTGLVAVGMRGGGQVRKPEQAVHCFHVATTRFADGSIRQSWTDTQGHTTTNWVPSPALNLLRATPAQLARFRIPPRPTNPLALRGWAAHWTHEHFGLIDEICEGGGVSMPGPFVSVCKLLVGNLGPLVDSSGNGGHLTSCRTVHGKTYPIPWYGGFPSGGQLEGAARPTAATCLTGTATGLDHDSYAVIVYERRPITGRYAHSWVPVRATWSDRPCTGS